LCDSEKFDVILFSSAIVKDKAPTAFGGNPRGLAVDPSWSVFTSELTTKQKQITTAYEQL
jgi:hypothetical protein